MRNNTDSVYYNNYALKEDYYHSYYHHDCVYCNEIPTIIILCCSNCNSITSFLLVVFFLAFWGEVSRQQ